MGLLRLLFRSRSQPQLFSASKTRHSSTQVVRQQELRNTKFIPFSVTEDQAIKRLKKQTRFSFFRDESYPVPGYLPYHLFSAKCQLTCDVSIRKKRSTSGTWENLGRVKTETSYDENNPLCQVYASDGGEQRLFLEPGTHPGSAVDRAVPVTSLRDIAPSRTLEKNIMPFTLSRFTAHPLVMSRLYTEEILKFEDRFRRKYGVGKRYDIKLRDLRFDMITYETITTKSLYVPTWVLQAPFKPANLSGLFKAALDNAEDGPVAGNMNYYASGCDPERLLSGPGLGLPILVELGVFFPFMLEIAAFFGSWIVDAMMFLSAVLVAVPLTKKVFDNRVKRAALIERRVRKYMEKVTEDTRENYGRDIRIGTSEERKKKWNTYFAMDSKRSWVGEKADIFECSVIEEDLEIILRGPKVIAQPESNTF